MGVTLGSEQLGIVIVCEHASAKFGGEAALPLHYFRVLRRRGFNVWLVTHARTRAELETTFPGERRILYIEDSPLHRFLWRFGNKLPAQLSHFTVGFISRLDVQRAQRRLVRKLVAEQRIDIIHQPMPVSPREPSMMHGLGAPVVIGPMNGGMNYPPGFGRYRRRAEQWVVGLGRACSSLMNRLIPGKRRAAFLLVANERTRRALPASVGTRVIQMVENGVDLTLWSPDSDPRLELEESVTTFAFVGRLVEWKAVDLLLRAFHRAAQQAPMRLLIIGDGDQRAGLESLANSLGIVRGSAATGSVSFAGWLTQEACARELRRVDCLVLPSLLECGGAVVLEAMSSGKPVIATDWGGPADYLDERCGVLVPPTDRQGLIDGFADAMVKVASSQELRRAMGEAGREKILREYDWEVKVDRMLEVYAAARAAPVA
jgi:glycosyltransferase involved in cell wall biosynthesis